MPTIFSKIVSGDIPCYKVAETDRLLAFLDINPLAQGHTLVIPKQEVDYIFDVEDELYTEMFLFAKQVGRAIERVVKCERIGVSIIGLEVPHAHIHLVPINSISDLDFTKTRAVLTREDFKHLAESIGKELIHED